MKSPQQELKSLEKAILDLHGCRSMWVKSAPIEEVFDGETVWEGVVQVFDLIDHPRAKRCYAWSHELEGSRKRKFFAVLHEGPIDSPGKAVRAMVVNEVHKRN